MLPDNEIPPLRYGPWLPTAALAKACGSKHYFTGKPCVNGHIEPRHTSNGTCIECTRIRVKIWASDHPDRMAELAPARRMKAALDYARDPQKYADRTRRSRSKNLEAYRERERRYRLEHSDEHRSRVRNRRARIKGNTGTHNASDVEVILVRQKFKCAECGKSVRMKTDRHVDHIMPIALGGSNWPSNLQILCPFCNQSKGARHPADFARKMGRLI